MKHVLLLLLLLLSWATASVLVVCSPLFLGTGSSPGSVPGFLLKLGRKFEKRVAGVEVLLGHDRSRHARFLSSSSSSSSSRPLSFPMGGKADPNAAGLYFTEIQLGTPPSTFYVQVDTGSDLLWVNCAPCTSCPTSTDLGVHLMLYDPELSSTSSILSCEDDFCSVASSGNCQHGETCSYELGYGDGSSSRGYFIEDRLQLNLLTGNNTANATVSFGCGTHQGGELQQQDQALDGIIGFGQSDSSIIKQLMSQGRTPGVFAHCLEGEGAGGGIFVIGNAQVPGIAYTPIVPNKSHYNVNMKSVTVENKPLQMDSQSYVSGGNTGTIIDSGTTLTYLTELVYQSLIEAIFLGGPPGIQTFSMEGMTCAIYSGSLDDAFPLVRFTFDKGATLEVKPHDYFIQAQLSSNTLWCIGFQGPSQNNLDLTIIGDLVLKDKLVVYDLDQQQIGWVNYNCSSNVSILTSTGKIETVTASAIVDSSNVDYLHWCPIAAFAMLLICYTIPFL